MIKTITPKEQDPKSNDAWWCLWNKKMCSVQPQATVIGNIQYSTPIISSVNEIIFLNISHIGPTVIC